MYYLFVLIQNNIAYPEFELYFMTVLDLLKFLVEMFPL